MPNKKPKPKPNDDDFDFSGGDDFSFDDDDAPSSKAKQAADPIQEAEQEVSATLTAFQERRKKEQERFDLVTDSEYWFAACFPTRALKEEFLRAINMLKEGDKYLDGMKLAAALGIQLKSPIPPIYKTRHEADWDDIALDFDPDGD